MEELNNFPKVKELASEESQDLNLISGLGVQPLNHRTVIYWSR